MLKQPSATELDIFERYKPENNALDSADKIDHTIGTKSNHFIVPEEIDFALNLIPFKI
jgi:hypothetical protein